MDMSFGPHNEVIEEVGDVDEPTDINAEMYFDPHNCGINMKEDFDSDADQPDRDVHVEEAEGNETTFDPHSLGIKEEFDHVNEANIYVAGWSKDDEANGNDLDFLKASTSCAEMLSSPSDMWTLYSCPNDLQVHMQNVHGSMKMNKRRMGKLKPRCPVCRKLLCDIWFVKKHLFHSHPNHEIVSELRRSEPGTNWQATIKKYVKYAPALEYQLDKLGRQRRRQSRAQCPVCGKVLCNTWYLNTHMNNAHRNKLTNKLHCPFCAEQFEECISIMEHIKEVHGKDDDDSVEGSVELEAQLRDKVQRTAHDSGRDMCTDEGGSSDDRIHPKKKNTLSMNFLGSFASSAPKYPRLSAAEVAPPPQLQELETQPEQPLEYNLAGSGSLLEACTEEDDLVVNKVENPRQYGARKRRRASLARDVSVTKEAAWHSDIVTPPHLDTSSSAVPLSPAVCDVVRATSPAVENSPSTSSVDIVFPVSLHVAQ